jgi:hypothetical protein
MHPPSTPELKCSSMPHFSRNVNQKKEENSGSPAQRALARKPEELD